MSKACGLSLDKVKHCQIMVEVVRLSADHLEFFRTVQLPKLETVEIVCCSEQIVRDVETVLLENGRGLPVVKTDLRDFDLILNRHYLDTDGDPDDE